MRLSSCVQDFRWISYPILDKFTPTKIDRYFRQFSVSHSEDQSNEGYLPEKTDRATGIICDQTIALDGIYTKQLKDRAMQQNVRLDYIQPGNTERLYRTLQPYRALRLVTTCLNRLTRCGTMQRNGCGLTITNVRTWRLAASPQYRSRRY